MHGIYDGHGPKMEIETQTQHRANSIENVRKYYESMMWKIDRGIMYVRDIAAIQICKICLMCRKFISIFEKIGLHDVNIYYTEKSYMLFIEHYDVAFITRHTVLAQTSF